MYVYVYIHGNKNAIAHTEIFLLLSVRAHTHVQKCMSKKFYTYMHALHMYTCMYLCMHTTGV
jgi:hypothetical protein